MSLTFIYKFGLQGIGILLPLYIFVLFTSDFRDSPMQCEAA